MRVFAEVAELLGDGDNTEANEGTFENVLVQTGPDLTECEPGQVIVDVKAACINYPDLLQTVVRPSAMRHCLRLARPSCIALRSNIASKLHRACLCASDRAATSTSPTCPLRRAKRQRASSPEPATAWIT